MVGFLSGELSDFPPCFVERAQEVPPLELTGSQRATLDTILGAGMAFESRPRVVFQGGAVYGVVTDDLGVPYVVRARLQLPSGHPWVVPTNVARTR